MMGSDITWKCLGNGKYAIRVTAYRSCLGIPIAYSPIVVSSKCGNYNHSGGNGPTGGRDITPVCKRSCTKCSSAGCEFPFGIEQYYYDDTVDLSSTNCCEFSPSWQQSARNIAIETGASGQNFYCEGTLNKCHPGDKPCDNSPYFTNPPVAIYCKGQCVIYNPGVNDDDMNSKNEADSLSYEFADPLQAAGTTIPYISGYSKESPLKFDGYPDTAGTFEPPVCKGFHLDPQTGELMFKATEAVITVMAINVNEWRKDSTGKYKKIGTIRRDLQISIIECPENRSPVITGIDCQKPTTMTFCANQSKCFTICSFDPDIDDTVSLSWNNQIPGGKFVVEEGKKWPKAQFCWAPTNAHVRSYPWRFVVTGVDNACPINGRTSKTFTLYVKTAPEGFIKQTKDKCGWVTLEAIVTNNVGIKEYVWNGPYSPRDALVNVRGGKLKVKYKPNPNQIPTKYPITVNIVSKDGCETQITDTVKIDQYVYPDLGPDTTVCVNTPMKLKTKTYFGKADFIYSWYVYNKATKSYDLKVDRVKDATDYNITASQDQIVVVKVLDGNGCDNDDTLRIHAQIPPAPFLGPDQRGCAGTPLTLNATKNAAGKVMPLIRGFQWYKSDGLGGWTGLPGKGTMDVKDSGTYKVIVTDSIGCTGTDEINVYFNPLVEVTKRTYIVCKGDSAHLDGGAGGAGTVWKWYATDKPGRPPVNTTKTYNYVPIGTSVGEVKTWKFRVTADQTIKGITCSDADTVTVEVHSLPKTEAGNPAPQCIDNPGYDLKTVPGQLPDNTGVWRSKTKSYAIINNTLYPKALGVGKHWITYRYTDPNTGCYKDDSAQIVIDTLPQVSAGKDTYRCMRDGKMQLFGQPAGGTWYTEPLDQDYLVGTQLSPQFDPEKAGHGLHKLIYSYQSKSSAKCDAQDTLEIFVYQPQTVDAGTYAPVCEKSGDLVLTATPNVPTAKWMGPGSEFIEKEAATGNWLFHVNQAAPGVYTPYFRVTYDNGRCPDSGSTTITVNALPKPKLTTADGRTEYCITEPDIVLQGTPGGGTYYMSGGGADALKGSSFSPKDAGEGVYKAVYRYKDPSTGCTNYDTLQLQIDNITTVKINPTPALCEGDAFVITATTSHDAGVVWTSETDPGNIISVADGQGTKTITYHPSLSEQGSHFFTVRVTAKNPGVCGDVSDVGNYEIYFPPTPEFTMAPSEGCSPLKVEFTNLSTVKGESADIAQTTWTYYDKDGKEIGKQVKPGVEATSFTFLDPKASPYSVKMEVVSKNGCVKSLTKGGIKVFESPRPDFIGRPTFTTIANPRIKFENTTDPTSIDDKTTWEWNFGDRYFAGGGSATTRDAEWTYHDTGKYTVSLKAINGNGCDATKTKFLYVDIRPEIIVFVPNVFTPPTNKRKLGPAENNTFRPVISHADKGEMFVYNRWGQLMYYSNAMIDVTDAKDGSYKSFEGWDGTHDGADAPMDVYVYLIKTTSFSGKEYKYTGTITLLR